MPVIEPFTKRDFDEAWTRFERFWPGRPGLRGLLHPVYLYQFGDTAYAMREEGALIAYLLGFISPAKPPEGFIHMVAVRQDLQGRGLGRELYRHFEAVALARGAVGLRAVTAPSNVGSVAFHRRLGFAPVDGGMRVNDIPVVPDYAGPGQHRVVLVKRFDAT